MRLNFKIGQKLAISSTIGILLVLSFVIVARVSLDAIESANTALEKASGLVGKLTDSKINLRDTVELYYRAKSASTAEAIDKYAADFEKVAPPLADYVGTVAEKAAIAANRERMSRAKVQLDGYISGWREGVGLQRQLILSQGKASELSEAWTKALAAARVSAGRIGQNVGDQLDTVAVGVGVANTGIWRYFATEDDKLKDEVHQALVAAGRGLRELQTNEHAQPMAASLSSLSELTGRFASLFEAISSAATQRTVIIRGITPKRAEVTRLIDETLDAAKVFVEERHHDVKSEIGTAKTIGLVLGGLTVAVLVASTVFGFVGVGNPVRRIAGVLEHLAEGNKAVDIPFTTRGDEVGETARAAQVFKDNLVRMEQLDAERQEAEARAEAEKKQAMHQLADTFEGAVGGIIGAVSSAAAQLQGAAQTMSAAADQTNRQSSAVASASEEATSNVQTVASAAEELATSVAEIGRRVNESAKIAAEAARDADATAAKVGRLSQAAQKIGDIVGLISTIAGQTNLLALNATIEAARAGDAGKGFAVVASEVKSLADQTAKATAEISAQIEEIQASTADSAHAIEAITETIRKMNEIATTIASAVEEQGAATTEIARNVQQASSGTAEVSSNIVGVTRAAADSSAASSQVLSSAGNLASQSGQLRAEVDRFLATVRAA
ncbi:Methyl-accepting chemotaxis protein 4 [Blastochloris viridis]|uniref:Methyl-accepting chemotaxis protein 4 n=1 Tax=Blastochloris viridis TaxID=1079 RepID=A0A0S4Q067_BLAVI|nr:Methyl-accepting chemotaxis protein 4 [Blastochloris viridis]